MNDTSAYTRTEQLLLWAGTHPRRWVASVSSIYALIFVVFYLLFDIVTDDGIQASSVISGVSIAIVLTIIIAFSSYRVASARLTRLSQALGFVATPEERVQLTRWFRKGTVPTIGRLQPVLENYLTYLEPFLTGRTIFLNPRVTKFFFFVYAAFFLLEVAVLIFAFDPSQAWIQIFAVLLFGYFSVISFPFTKHNRAYRFVGRKNIQRLQQRRAELEQ